MKPNTAAHVLLILPVLVSLCFATPAWAATPLGSQTPASQTPASQTPVSQAPASQTIVPSSVEPLSIQRPRSPSFYQQQLDKLKYTPDTLLRSQNASALRKKDKQQVQSQSGQSQSEQSQVIRPPSPEITAAKDNQATPQQLTVSGVNSHKLDSIEKEKTPSVKERIQQQVQTQKRNPTDRTSLFSASDKTSRRDPYAILEAAKSKHSPLQGRHLDIEPFSADQVTDKIDRLKPDLSPLKQQIPEKIDRLRADFQSTVQQQPEQLQRALTAAKTDLQQRSANRLNGPFGSVKNFVQRTVKDPLSHLLRKIGIAAQATAEQLQDSK